jgi:NAD-specific glutamate dehydrogenase
MDKIEIIKKYRIAADLSWQELSDEIGIERKHLQNMVYCNVKPGPRTEHRIQRWYTRNRADIEAALAELQPITAEGCRDARHAHI